MSYEGGGTVLPDQQPSTETIDQAFLLQQVDFSVSLPSIHQEKGTDRQWQNSGSATTMSSARHANDAVPASSGATSLSCLTMEENVTIGFSTEESGDLVMKDTDTFCQAMAKYDAMLRNQVVYRGLPKHPDTTEIYIKKGRLFWRNGKCAEAVEMYEKVLEINKLVTPGVDPSWVSGAYCHMAENLEFRGKAMKLHRKLFEFQLSTAGEDSVDTANAYDRMGHVLQSFDKIDEALEWYTQALKIRLKTAVDDLDLADAYESMAKKLGGWQSRKVGRDEDALKMWEKALEIRLQILGNNNEAVAHSYEEMADIIRNRIVYDRTGNGEEEAKMRSKAREIRLKIAERDNPAAADALEKMARSLLDGWEEREATKMYMKAISVRKRISGEDHEATIDAYERTADALKYNHWFKHDKSVELRRKVLDFRLMTVGPEHPDTARAYKNTAVALIAIRGNEDEAVRMYERAIEIYMLAAEGDASSIRYAFRGIADILTSQRKYKEAIAMHKKAMDFQLKTVDHDHLDMAETYGKYADALLRVKGKEHEAVEMCRKSMRIRLEESVFDDPILRKDYERLGDCLRRLGGKEGEVVEMYRKSLDLVLLEEGNFGEKAKACLQLATALEKIDGKRDEAIEMYRKAMEMSLQVEGHLDSKAIAYGELASALEKVGGKWDEALDLYRKALKVLLKHKEQGNCGYAVSKVEKRLIFSIQRLEGSNIIDRCWKFCCRKWDKMTHPLLMVLEQALQGGEIGIVG
ncbi:unnamed protein product [Cylindrotheca closterium]|uniref:Uncharacterized protein n=1 Tax=Cylindrotheca closterium TaxID=2856 RepID=A0AAD2FD75_9STRA|nr:unnamed protein product [Cylindrotheca closterium]